MIGLLTTSRERQGRTDEAISLLRADGTTLVHPNAAFELMQLLSRHGREVKRSS